MAVIKEHPLLRFCLAAMDDEDDEDGDREDDLGVSKDYCGWCRPIIVQLQELLLELAKSLSSVN